MQKQKKYAHLQKKTFNFVESMRFFFVFEFFVSFVGDSISGHSFSIASRTDYWICGTQKQLNEHEKEQSEAQMKQKSKYSVSIHRFTY